MVLRPYQLRAVEFLQGRVRGFIHAPAGSGKTWIAAAALDRWTQTRHNPPIMFPRIVWLANTREQCDQAREAIEAVGIPAEEYDAENVNAAMEINVCCVAAQPDVSKADLIIIDEAHHLPAKTWTSLVMFSKAVIWGFSATPWSKDYERDNELKLFFSGMENFFAVPRDEVKAIGGITHGVVHVHDIDMEGADDANIESLAAAETLRRKKRYPLVPVEEHHRRCLWQFTAEAVRNSFARNRCIEMIAKQTADSVLILVNQIEHGERLQKHIPDSVVVHSKLGKKKRLSIIDGFKSGALRVMIATSLADEGLDVPRASVLILACGGRSEGKLEQRTGRVLRPFDGKNFGVIHDFADRAAKLAHAQFKSRMRSYKKLGYELK